MSSWQSQLKKLMRVSDKLPEPLSEIFGVQPSSGGNWPSHLPPCPALQEFHALCDGGTFSHYTLHPQAELHDFHEECDEVVPGRYVVIGDTEFGHSLFWDSSQDQVGYYDLDGADGLVMSDEAGAELMGRTMADFLAGLFTPPRHMRGDQVQEMWAQVLAVCQGSAD